MQGVSGLDRRCCSRRLWHEVGCRAVLEELAAGRQFRVLLPSARYFLTVLHRLFVSGSDPRCRKSGEPTTGSRALRPFSCIISTAPMAWLGEPLADQAGASELTPRWPQGPRGRGAGLPVGATCSPNSASSSWTPPACSFEGRGGEGAWSSRPFERTTARISIR